MAKILQDKNSLNPNKISSFQPQISKTEPKIFTKKNISPEYTNQPNLNTKNSNSKTDPNNLIPVYNLSFSTNGSKPDNTVKPYNPLTNYTSPRPEFLRYNPNKKKEIFLSIEQEIKEEKLSDEVGFEKMSYLNLKRGFKIFFLFACLVVSVGFVSFISSNQDFELNAKGSEVSAFGNNFLGDMIGFSNICLNRSNIEFSCGIEERNYYLEKEEIIEIIPIELNGFQSIKKVNISVNEILVDIGLLAQENREEELPKMELNELKNNREEELHKMELNTVKNKREEELPEMELNELENIQIDSNKPIELKSQIYLPYLFQALACFSILIAFVTSLYNNYMKFYKNKKADSVIKTNESETKINVKKMDFENEIVNQKEKNIDEKLVFREKIEEFMSILPPQVELLNEFSINEINKENVSLVKGSYNSPVLSKRDKITFEGAKENFPLSFTKSMAKMRKKEEIKDQKEEILMTPLRRSSRIRTKITSP